MNRSRSIITTEDGTTIMVDPEIGAVSGRNRETAEREIARRKALERGTA